MSFTLKQARYFIAAAQAGQVSRAAVDLNISQSAITSSIQQLESFLGYPLFERRRDGVVLTSAGARFLRHAERVMAAVDDAIRMRSGTPISLEGRVRIGMTYTVAGYFAAPLINRARRHFPNLDIALVERQRDQIEKDLLRGDLDLSIILTSNLKNHDRIAHTTLVNSTRHLWLPSDHALSREKIISLRDVIDFDYIALSVDEAIQTQRSYWDIASVNPKIVFETSSVEAVRTMVAAGMGITVLSDMVFRPWSLEGQRIERRELIDDIPTMDVGLAWSAHAELSDATRGLREFFEQSVGNKQNNGEGEY